MDKHFSEKEQGRIFKRALKLQKEAGLTMTLSQMEATALEAGIDPRFLNAAITEIELHPAPSEPVATTFQKIGLCAAAMAQIYVSSGWGLEVQRDVYVLIGISAMLGAVSVGKQLWKNLAATLLVIGITTLLTVAFLSTSGKYSFEFFWIYFRNATLVQSLAFLVGSGVAEFLGFLKSRSSSKIVTAPVIQRSTVIASGSLNLDQETNELRH